MTLVFAIGGQAEVQTQPAAGEQSVLIRITAPRQNLRQTANFVDLRFELTNPTAATASSPNFKIQLDSNNPVNTTTSQQSFTGLTTGSHVVTVELVDANGTVIPNSQAQVQFTVVPTTQNSPAPQSGSRGGGSLPQAKATISRREMAKNIEDSLPPASSSLPILSIVGFGVLVGGVISAMRTR